MKAVGYSRVSSRQQAESGLGESAQTAAIAEYAAKAGLRCVQFVDRAVEGDTPIDKRPGLLDALSALEKGDVLVCARYDRLGRDVILSTLIEREVARRGAKTISCAGEASGVEGPGGELVRTVLFAVAAYEKTVIALRTRAALRAKRARGERAGSTPFGFTVADEESGRLEPIPMQQTTLTIMRVWRSEGMSYASIAQNLNEMGYNPQRGVKWWPSSVRAVLQTAGKMEAKA